MFQRQDSNYQKILVNELTVEKNHRKNMKWTTRDTFSFSDNAKMNESKYKQDRFMAKIRFTKDP